VAFIYARFDVTFFSHAIRPCKALRGGFGQAKIYSNKKASLFSNVLHFIPLKQAKLPDPEK
jgi:hypothetical protein